MRKSLAVLVFVLFATASWAEDLYVAQTAQGGDTGADAANAHAASWFNTSGNWGSGIGKISAGDTVHLVGTITSSLTIQLSGSSGSLITIIYESAAKSSTAAWGQTTAGAIYASGKNFIVIDGGTNGIIESTDNGDSLGSNQGAYGITLTNCDDCEVKNLTIRNLYIHTTNTTNALSAYHTRGLFIENCNRLSAHNNTINNCYTGIHEISNGESCSTHDLYNNTISACSTAIFGPTLSGGSDSFDGVTIHDNEIIMGGNWDDPAGDNHIDGIHGFGVTGTTNRIDNLKVFRNFIHGNPSTRCTAFIFMEYGIYGAQIYNNICIGLTNRPNEGYIHSKFQSAQGTISVSIYNNTIVGLANDATGGNGINITQTSSLTANVYNNSISSCFTGIYTGASKTGTWNIDNQVYFNCGYPGWLASGSATIGAWRLAIGGDAASSTSTPNASAPYYIPVATSSAIGAGANLSAFFTTDISGAARSGWDIGAVDDATTIWTVGASGSGGGGGGPTTVSRSNQGGRYHGGGYFRRN